MEVTLRELIARLSSLLQENRPIIVKNRKQPVAVLVPLNDGLKKRFPELYREIEIARIMEEAEQSHIPVDEIVERLRQRINKEDRKHEEGK